MSITGDPWPWYKENNHVVAPEQLMVAVYQNSYDEIVIRQKADIYDDGDTLICLTPENAFRIGVHLLERAKAMGITSVRPFQPDPVPVDDGAPCDHSTAPGPLLEVMLATAAPKAGGAA